MKKFDLVLFDCDGVLADSERIANRVFAGLLTELGLHFTPEQMWRHNNARMRTMPHVAARMARGEEDAGRYQRHRPEQTLLYRIVDEVYPAFAALMAKQDRALPGYVHREFEEFLKCGRLENGFLRVRCENCHTEELVAFSCKRRGFCPSCGARRMAESAALLVDEVLPEQPVRQWVLSFPFQLRFLFASRPEVMGRVLGIVYRAIETRLIQRFGSALNLNIHFHMLFLDGVYAIDTESLVFRPVSPLSPKVLESLVQMISQRVGCYLEHQGWLARNIENSYLQLEAPDDSAINDLLGHSITYRIAVGPQAGRKALNRHRHLRAYRSARKDPRQTHSAYRISHFTACFFIQALPVDFVTQRVHCLFFLSITKNKSTKPAIIDAVN